MQDKQLHLYCSYAALGSNLHMTTPIGSLGTVVCNCIARCPAETGEGEKQLGSKHGFREAVSVPERPSQITADWVT